MSAATALPETVRTAPATSNTPSLTLPQLLAFAAFVVFVVLTIVATGKPDATVQASELDEVRLFALFLIATLLPSDLLVRFGRNLLFQSTPDAKSAARAVPATTLAQWLAFFAFLTVTVLTLVSNSIVSTDEFGQVNEVARVLVLALLPSDAGLRFGRALYYRSPRTPDPTPAQLKHV